MREFRRMVYLNDEIYDRNVTATTLQNALIGNIAGVTHEYGRAGVVVRYSRPETSSSESEIAELRRTIGEVQAELEVLQSKVNELQGKIWEDAEVLAERQTARLVICAFGVYSWNLVSDVDKTDLAQYNICTFWDLFHARFLAGPGRNSARRICRNMDESMLGYAEILISKKGSVAASRRHLAHPSISNDRLLEFLVRLGLGDAGLEPLQVDMFNFLKLVSNTEENIARAMKCG
ncbi:hypothetical protein JOM56_002600 [Amanita muscaria]